jgi:hypothetical protein
MRTFIEKPHMVKLVNSITCDLCKAQYSAEEWGIKPRGGTFNIEFSYNKFVPNDDAVGGHTEGLSLDICDICWDSEILPWLKSKGLNTEYKVVSW